MLADERIDWQISDRWVGICGKRNLTIGAFAVGCGKEYAYATYNAPSNSENPGYRQIRALEPGQAAA